MQIRKTAHETILEKKKLKIFILNIFNQTCSGSWSTWRHAEWCTIACHNSKEPEDWMCIYGRSSSQAPAWPDRFLAQILQKAIKKNFLDNIFLLF